MAVARGAVEDDRSRPDRRRRSERRSAAIAGAGLDREPPADRPARLLRGAVRGRRPRRALDGGPLADVRALGADRAARLARRAGRVDSLRAAALGEAPGLRGELDRVRYRGPVVVRSEEHTSE